MSRRHKRLIVKAHKRFGRVFPCRQCSRLLECFTRERGRLIFWYNTADGSTHVEM
jgi:hypothetical protein